MPLELDVDTNPSFNTESMPSNEILDHMKVQLLVRAYQIRGHQLAKLDPLGINFMHNEASAPELKIEHYGFTEADLNRKFHLGKYLILKYVIVAANLLLFYQTNIRFRYPT